MFVEIMKESGSKFFVNCDSLVVGRNIYPILIVPYPLYCHFPESRQDLIISPQVDTPKGPQKWYIGRALTHKALETVYQ